MTNNVFELGVFIVLKKELMLPKEEVSEIINEKKFYHLFQPLFNLNDWTAIGFEALLRCDSVDNPEMLFKSAIQSNMLYDLDTCSIRNVLNSSWLSNKSMFVNVYPSTLMNPSFIGFLDSFNELRIKTSKIVFEINEAEKVLDLSSFRQVIDTLKQKGFGIAIDDYGKGEASLKSVIELEPDYVKLDKSITQGLYNSDEKQIEIKMMLDVCQEKGMKMVLEGIEDERDLAVAKILGVHIGQGYLIGEPTCGYEVYFRERDF